MEEEAPLLEQPALGQAAVAEEPAADAAAARGVWHCLAVGQMAPN